MGAAGWTEADEHDLLDIGLFKEKPDREFAEEYLRVEGLPENTYLTVFGLYVLTPGIFERLRKNVQECEPEGHEIQLTDALDDLRRTERVLGLVLDGEKIDIGLPAGYLDGLMKYAGGK